MRATGVDGRSPLRARAAALVAVLATAVACSSSSGGVAAPGDSLAVTIPGPAGAHLAGRELGRGAVGIVLAHGASTTMESWYAPMDELAAAGYRVLAFDARGVGGSTGMRSTDPADRAADIHAAIRYLRGRGAQQIVVMGSSLGAHASVLAAGHDDLAALVLVSPATVPLGLDRVKVPVFVVVSRDDRVPASNARVLARHFGRPPRLVSGAVHGADLFATHPDTVRAVLAFLTRVAPARS